MTEQALLRGEGEQTERVELGESVSHKACLFSFYSANDDNTVIVRAKHTDDAGTVSHFEWGFTLLDLRYRMYFPGMHMSSPTSAVDFIRSELSSATESLTIDSEMVNFKDFSEENWPSGMDMVMAEPEAGGNTLRVYKKAGLTQWFLILKRRKITAAEAAQNRISELQTKLAKCEAERASLKADNEGLRSKVMELQSALVDALLPSCSKKESAKKPDLASATNSDKSEALGKSAEPQESRPMRSSAKGGTFAVRKTDPVSPPQSKAATVSSSSLPSMSSELKRSRFPKPSSKEAARAKTVPKSRKTMASAADDWRRAPAAPKKLVTIGAPLEFDEGRTGRVMEKYGGIADHCRVINASKLEATRNEPAFVRSVLSIDFRRDRIGKRVCGFSVKIDKRATATPTPMFLGAVNAQYLPLYAGVQVGDREWREGQTIDVVINFARNKIQCIDRSRPECPIGVFDENAERLMARFEYVAGFVMFAGKGSVVSVLRLPAASLAHYAKSLRW